MNKTVEPNELLLPNCPIPRPGESVVYYSDARPINGTLKGHNPRGQAVIINQFGNQDTKNFDAIRPSDPMFRQGPNWLHLPTEARIYRPTDDQTKLLTTLLGRRIFPGPSYKELFYEIWARGFEAFLVGGTVRDVICGRLSNDIDVATTMPLRLLRNVISPMYFQNDTGNAERGYIRIGGTPDSGDPFMDLKVFSDSLQGTRNAVFGVDFGRDAVHRDFACNSLYYDPVNNAILDPFGYGLEDAKNSRLNYVCGTGAQRQMAQIFVRIVKFHIRGFEVTQHTVQVMKNTILDSIPTMKRAVLKDYVRTQILSKQKSNAEKISAIKSFQNFFVDYGVSHIYQEYFIEIVAEFERELSE